MNLGQLFRILKEHPRAYMPDTNFTTVVAFINGCDVGSGNELLNGFSEYLQMRLDKPSNLVWSGMVLQIALGRPYIKVSPDQSANAFDSLLGLLEGFMTMCDELGGRDAVVERYNEWHSKYSQLLEEYLTEIDTGDDSVDEFREKFEAWRRGKASSQGTRD